MSSSLKFGSTLLGDWERNWVSGITFVGEDIWVEASEGVGVGEEVDSSSVSGITSSRSIEAFEGVGEEGDLGGNGNFVVSLNS